MQNIARPELQAMLERLEQAILHHQQWYEMVARGLVCRLPFNPRLALPMAHRECVFGHWYYNNASEKLHAHPAFIAMETQHKEMHELASVLIHQSEGGGPILAADYDRFTSRMAQFRLELETLTRELESVLTNLDPLTGASNRIGMLSWLRAQQELVKRNVLSCCVAMIDIDRFKSINDSYGHMVGDSVLKGVAHYLMEHLRPYDKLYRYGGEEFLLCVQGVELGAAYTLVDRLRSGLAENPIVVDPMPIRCTVSCGVALLATDTPLEKAIERADKALYASKAGGRNCTLAWDPSMR